MNVLLRWMVSSLSGLLVMSYAGAQDVAGTFERTLTIDEPVELDVRSGSGSIAVRPGSTGQVQVQGRIHVWPRRDRSSDDIDELVRRIEADPPIEVSGNRVRVGHLADRDDDDLYRNVSISYEIEVPRQTEVRSGTGSGSQEIDGISGPVAASAGSGSITLTDIGGSVDAATGSGSIKADGIAGAFDARAGSGLVTLVQAAAGDVNVATGSGSSDLRGVDGALQARAGSGRISVQGEPRGRWDLTTGSGSIRVDVPADAAFELDARANSGRIQTSHPVTMQGAIEEGHVSGQVRGGGPVLHMRSGSGSITIE